MHADLRACNRLKAETHVDLSASGVLGTVHGLKLPNHMLTGVLGVRSFSHGSVWSGSRAPTTNAPKQVTYHVLAQW